MTHPRHPACKQGNAAIVVRGDSRGAWPWLPTLAHPGSVWQGPAGELLRIDERGHAERWPAKAL